MENRTDKLKKDAYEEAASANECTGLLQKMDIDSELILRYHEEYNK